MHCKRSAIFSKHFSFQSSKLVKILQFDHKLIHRDLTTFHSSETIPNFQQTPTKNYFKISNYTTYHSSLADAPKTNPPLLPIIINNNNRKRVSFLSSTTPLPFHQGIDDAECGPNSTSLLETNAAVCRNICTSLCQEKGG